MSTVPEIGQLAIVRKRPFVVTEIVPSSPLLSGDAAKSNHLVKLSSVEDDGLGEELQVIWELEPGTAVYEKSTLPDPDSFDPPKRLQAFLDAVRWGSVSQSDDRALQSPFRSGIEIGDYQLDPVVRALSMPRVNLLIADDVGLGKTIEAGLVVQEMILRHRVRSVLIVCSSSLQVQWKEEMRDKFGLEFRIIDSESISQLRRKRGIRVNPWNHFPRLITSIDFLKRERPLSAFRETLNAELFPRTFDLLIVDEAHNVAPSGRGKYATDSMRTLAIRSIAPHFEHKLFLSATPHNGYRESFAALLELLDSQRFARAVTPDRAQLEAVMVRRMKSELKLRWDGSRRFAERIVKHLEVPYTDEERQAHHNLQQYSELRLKQATSDGECIAAEFVLKLLKKRLFSSPAAFGITLEKHVATVGGRKAASTASRDIADFSDDYADDDEYEAEAGEVVSSVSQALSPLSAEEKILLQQLGEYAAKASQRPDSKAQALIDWLKTTLRPGGQWNEERIILFTEYRATQKWLFDLLAREGFAAEGRLEMIYGGMPNDQREIIKAAFQAHPRESALRILLATDAASEGVNLQNHCSRLIHIEIPWNPNRMEQRNGRVDRHGQKADEVNIHHFVGRGFDTVQTSGKVGNLEADLEFLMRAALKVETIREDLGKVGPVIATQVKHLSRVSACVVDDSALTHPVVIAHGRIVVLGGDNHRLHEEIITAGGALIEGRFSRLNVGETKAALEAATDTSAPAAIQARFQALWPKHRDALMAALEARCVERTKNLKKTLDDRAENEVNNLTSIMMELLRSVQAELAPKQLQQLDLWGDEPGKQQRERDLAALRRRLSEIPQEIERESAHIRSRFANPSARLFPVAVHLADPAQGSAGNHRGQAMSVSRHHADWLSLIEVSGPFVSLPVLLRTFPQGVDPRDPAQAKALRAAYEACLTILAILLCFNQLSMKVGPQGFALRYERIPGTRLAIVS